MSDLTQEELSKLRTQLAGREKWGISWLRVGECLAMLDMAERTVIAEGELGEERSHRQHTMEALAAADAKVAQLREALELMAATASLPAYEQGIAEKVLEETR